MALSLPPRRPEFPNRCRLSSHPAAGSSFPSVTSRRKSWSSWNGRRMVAGSFTSRQVPCALSR